MRTRIVGAPRDDTADAAAGRGVVAGPSGDKVQMAVKNGLAGRGAVIRAEVKAGNSGIGGLKISGDHLRQPVGGGPFVGGEVAEGGDMAAGNDEGMAVADRIAIAEGHAGTILGQNAFGGQVAKQTGGIHGGKIGKKSPAGKQETQETRTTAGE